MVPPLDSVKMAYSKVIGSGVHHAQDCTRRTGARSTPHRASPEAKAPSNWACASRWVCPARSPLAAVAAGHRDRARADFEVVVLPEVTVFGLKALRAETDPLAAL
jgi:hypothetical protein